MTVAEVIEDLKNMPQDAEFRAIHDGYSCDLSLIWLSKGGAVIVADFDEVVYKDKNRPIGAPDEKQKKYWHTPFSKDSIKK